MPRKDVPQDSLTCTYTTADWQRQSMNWLVRAYWVDPSSGLPIEQPSVSANGDGSESLLRAAQLG